MVSAFIGLGSNQGSRIHLIARAVEALAELPETHVERVSRIYESEPAYLFDQPKFANAVAEIRTGLQSDQLLGYLHDIENELGRVREIENGPRSIDLDILLFGDEEIDTPDLTIPHPRLTERDFVVTPLLEIAPRLHLPNGQLIRREDATEGVVIGDLGEVPDLGRSHQEPVFAEDWVEVARTDARHDAIAGWDAALALKTEVLKEAGIPYGWDPYEPVATMNPFGLPRTFRLLVPKADAKHAAELLGSLVSAVPEPGEAEGTD